MSDTTPTPTEVIPLKLRDCDRAFLSARAIAPDVAAERGYVTANGNLAALGFSSTQQQLGPGLLIPLYTVNGARAFPQLRPDTPRVLEDGERGPKYETPAGARLVVDVHPRVRAALGHPTRPLLICESAPKADACISAGMAAIAVVGVWGWRGRNARGGRTALADFEAIALHDRPVYLTFDSDVWSNPHVRLAVERFGAWLAHKARVKVCRIPTAPSGSKQGVDDFIAAGGDLKQLLRDAVPLGAFLETSPLPDPLGNVPRDADAAYWQARALAAEARHREFMLAMRCENPSFRKVIPTLAAVHLAYDAAVSQDATADPRLARALGPDGSLRVSRRTLAEISGRGEATMTADLDLLVEHGRVARDTVRLFPGAVDPDTGEVLTEPRSIMRVMPLASAVENFRYARAVPKPDATQHEPGWGGARLCAKCGSQHVEVVCLDCGHRQLCAARNPKKPMQTVKAQVDLSESATAEPAVEPVEGDTTTTPRTKKRNLIFHDVDAENSAGLKAQVDSSGTAIAARIRALREAQPAARAATAGEPAFVALDERILQVVTAASARKQPIHEDDIPQAVGACGARDVRASLRVLASQQRVKRWQDGYVTTPMGANGAD